MSCCPSWQRNSSISNLPYITLPWRGESRRGVKMQIIPKKYIDLARFLRRTQTPWERILWQHLRGNRFYGVQFKRQVRLGSYIVDFYCASKKLIIELDGAHHNTRKFSERDRIKEKYFRSQGYKVLRFWNKEIETNLTRVLGEIRREILFETPLPFGHLPYKERKI